MAKACGYMVRDRRGSKVVTATTRALAQQVARQLERVDAATRRKHRGHPAVIARFTAGPFRVTRVCPSR